MENDTLPSGENSGEIGEPTVSELAQACGEILSEEDLTDLSQMELEEALGYAFTLLLENGVEDPEDYLREKGILQ